MTISHAFLHTKTKLLLCFTLLIFRYYVDNTFKQTALFTFSRGIKRKSTDRKSIKVPRNSLDKFTVVVDKNARSDGLLTEEEEQYWNENFRTEDASLKGEVT